jgi:hypothetical protein
VDSNPVVGVEAAEGRLRGVCLLTWLGANPRAKVPLDEDDHEATWTSPLEAAASDGKLDIIKRLKPDPTRDDLNALLGESICCLNVAVVRYWISLEADMNSTEEDGTNLHGRIIEDLDLHGLVSHQTLQPAVLLLQASQAPRLVHLHAPILGPPLVKRRLADVVPRAHRFHRRVALCLPKNPDDLFFTEFALFHVLLHFLPSRTLLLSRPAFRGQVNWRFSIAERRRSNATLLETIPLISKYPCSFNTAKTRAEPKSGFYPAR